MPVKTGLGFIAAALTLSLMVGCEVETTDPDVAATLQDMVIADGDIQGWTTDGPATTYGGVQELAQGAFNGEAFFYTESPLTLDLVQASGQSLSGANNRSCNAYVLEFLTATDAQTAYSRRKEEEEGFGYTPIAVSGFDLSMASLYQSADYYMYACFEKFLVKVELSTMASASDAGSNAAAFLGFYDAKTR
jgi:hypothetical protein